MPPILQRIPTLAEMMAMVDRQVVAEPRRGRGLPGKLNANRLVILRMGLGRDSMTMLVLLAQRELVVDGGDGLGARKRGPDEVDAVVFTDPGHEWSFTYDLIPRVRAFCARHGIRFLWQKKPPAEGPNGWIAWKLHQVQERAAAKRQGRASNFGKPPWQQDLDMHGQVSWDLIEARCASGYYHDRIPLFEDYGAKDAWIAKTDSSCTINHKIDPGRKLEVDLQVLRFGRMDSQGSKRKTWHTRQGGAWSDAVARGEEMPHLNLIGYAGDEERRLKSVKEKKSDWSEYLDTEAYPLMQMGITKAGEAKYLESLPGVDPAGRFVAGGFADVKKSGCRSCIHQDRAQWWMLRELDPAYFQQIARHEQRVVKRRGPWQAIFPESCVAVARGRNPRVTPRLAEARRAGLFAVLARKVRNPEGDNPRHVYAVVPDEDFDLEFDLEADEQERCVVFVWKPLEAQVDEWLAEYRATWRKPQPATGRSRARVLQVDATGDLSGTRGFERRDPDVEEIARKEYRGCPLEKGG